MNRQPISLLNLQNISSNSYLLLVKKPVVRSSIEQFAAWISPGQYLELMRMRQNRCSTMIHAKFLSNNPMLLGFYKAFKKWELYKSLPDIYNAISYPF